MRPADKEIRYTDVKVPGLTLCVKPATKHKPTGSKMWRLRYVHNGKANMIALGEYAEDNKIRKAYNRRDPYARIQERREMLQRYADLLDHLKRQLRENI